MHVIFCAQKLLCNARCTRRVLCTRSMKTFSRITTRVVHNSCFISAAPNRIVYFTSPWNTNSNQIRLRTACQCAQRALLSLKKFSCCVYTTRVARVAFNARYTVVSARRKLCAHPGTSTFFVQEPLLSPKAKGDAHEAFSIVTKNQRCLLLR